MEGLFCDFFKCQFLVQVNSAKIEKAGKQILQF